MKRLILVLLSFAALTALTACVAPTGGSQSALMLPPPPPGQGRVFIYRLSDLTTAWNQPTVTMNGRVAGQAVPGRYFYCDLPPGNYVVQTASDPDRQAAFSIAPGVRHYVRLNHVFAGIAQVYMERKLGLDFLAVQEAIEVHFAGVVLAASLLTVGIAMFIWNFVQYGTPSDEAVKGA